MIILGQKSGSNHCATEEHDGLCRREIEVPVAVRGPGNKQLEKPEDDECEAHGEQLPGIDRREEVQVHRNGRRWKCHIKCGAAACKMTASGIISSNPEIGITYSTKAV